MRIGGMIFFSVLRNLVYWLLVDTAMQFCYVHVYFPDAVIGWSYFSNQESLEVCLHRFHCPYLPAWTVPSNYFSFLCRYVWCYSSGCFLTVVMLESLVHSSVAAYKQEKLAYSFGKLKKAWFLKLFHRNATNNDVAKHLLDKGSSLCLNSVIMWHVASSSSCELFDSLISILIVWLANHSASSFLLGMLSNDNLFFMYMADVSGF